VDRSIAQLKGPALPPASYLAWASWWHRVDLELSEAIDAGRKVDVHVLDPSRFWERMLAEVSRDASKAMLTRDRTIEPALTASRTELGEAARVARSRTAWARKADDPRLRPDTAVARLMQALLTVLDEAIEPAGLSR
jgi:glycine/D-amino acid oxidase-like deaminating enzyme